MYAASLQYHANKDGVRSSFDAKLDPLKTLARREATSSVGHPLKPFSLGLMLLDPRRSFVLVYSSCSDLRDLCDCSRLVGAAAYRSHHAVENIYAKIPVVRGVYFTAKLFLR